MQIGDQYQIHGDGEENIYTVRGIDPTANRYWLTVNDPHYEGYNGDLIISGTKVGNFIIALCDARSNLPGKIQLKESQQ